MADISHFERALGTSQGRIQPVGYTPVDGLFAFVLGHDLRGEFGVFNIGDKVEVSQTADFDTAELLRLNLRLRAPSVPLIGRTATDAVTDATGSILTSVDINWIQDDVGRPVTAGGQPDAEIVAVTGNDATIFPAWAPSLPPTAITLTGAKWRFSILVDAVERASRVLTRGKLSTAVDLVDFAVNVSALASATLTFRLELEAE